MNFFILWRNQLPAEMLYPYTTIPDFNMTSENLISGTEHSGTEPSHCSVSGEAAHWSLYPRGRQSCWPQCRPAGEASKNISVYYGIPAY